MIMVIESVARVSNRDAFLELVNLNVDWIRIWVTEGEDQDPFEDKSWPQVFLLHVPTRVPAFVNDFSNHSTEYPALVAQILEADAQRITWLIIQDKDE